MNLAANTANHGRELVIITSNRGEMGTSIPRVLNLTPGSLPITKLQGCRRLESCSFLDSFTASIRFATLESVPVVIKINSKLGVALLPSLGPNLD